MPAQEQRNAVTYSVAETGYQFTLERHLMIPHKHPYLFEIHFEGVYILMLSGQPTF